MLERIKKNGQTDTKFFLCLRGSRSTRKGCERRWPVMILFVTRVKNREKGSIIGKNAIIALTKRGWVERKLMNLQVSALACE